MRIGAVAVVRFRRCAARHIERPLLHEEESCGDQGRCLSNRTPRITYADRAIIRGYFRQHGLVPLLRPANMEALFPEFRKYLLPDELECRLSVLPAGYRRILTGGAMCC